MGAFIDKFEGIVLNSARRVFISWSSSIGSRFSMGTFWQVLPT